jgi:4-(2-carboxyphenyl)-2-oxobut-3-enoate aldolase
MATARTKLMKASDLSGVIGYLLTPVRSDALTPDQYAIDVDEAARAADALIRDGVSALCLNGTFGEVASLTWDELKLFTSTVVEAARGRVPVFAGATTLNTRDTITRACGFREIGAQGLMLGRPMMSPLSDPNIVSFYQAIAQSCPDLNIFLYDDPEAFRRPISTPVYRELAKIPQIIGAKYRTRLNISGLTDNSYNVDAETVAGHIKLLPGEFDWLITARLYGVDACWSSLVCGGPAPVMALRDALAANRWSEAETLTREISHCYEGIIPNHNFEAWHLDKVPFMKARFAAAGYLKPGPALPPYQYLSPERRKIAEECGRRSRALQEKYRDRAVAA